MAVLHRATELNVGLVHGISGLSLICFVVALVGIKLKWFKHRLIFNEANGNSFTEVASSSSDAFTASAAEGGLYRSSTDGAVPQIIRATFRPFDEMDVVPAAVLPPIRINNNRPPIRPRSRAPLPPQTITSSSTDVTERTLLVSDTDFLPFDPAIQEHEVLAITPELKSEEPIRDLDSYGSFHNLNRTESNHSDSTISQHDPVFLIARKRQETVEDFRNSPQIYSEETKVYQTDIDQIDSSFQVGSVSVDILPAFKEEIQFSSLEDLSSQTFSNISPSPSLAHEDRKIHLEPPKVPVPPNSPPPRSASLNKPLQYAEVQFEDNEQEEDISIFEGSNKKQNGKCIINNIGIINKPSPVIEGSSYEPYEETEKDHQEEPLKYLQETNLKELPNLTTHTPSPPPYTEHDTITPAKASRHVTIVTPEATDSDEEPPGPVVNIPVHEMTRTQSTPNLVSTNLNSPADMLPPMAARRLDMTQSTPDLSENQKVPSTPAKTIAAFFGFFTGRSQKDALPTNIKKKTKTIRVLKQPKQPQGPKLIKEQKLSKLQMESKDKLPSIERSAAHSNFEQIHAPLPMQRKKRQVLQGTVELKQLEALKPVPDVPKPTSPGKMVRFAEQEITKPPVPMQRTIHNVNGENLDPTDTSEPPQNGFMIFKGDVPVEPQKKELNYNTVADDDNDDDLWNMVARHRHNNAQMVAKQATIIKKMPATVDKSEAAEGAARQLELFNRPKTLREMQREQRERREREQFGSREQMSDTEA